MPKPQNRSRSDFQCHAEGGAGISKRKQTQTNADRRKQTQRRKRKQTLAKVETCKQPLTPPFIAVFHTPLCDPLRFQIAVKSRDLKSQRALQNRSRIASKSVDNDRAELKVTHLR